MLKAAQLLRSDDRVHDARPDSPLTVPLVAIRSASADIMVFVGFDSDQARRPSEATAATFVSPRRRRLRAAVVAPWHCWTFELQRRHRLRRQRALDRDTDKGLLQLDVSLQHRT